LPRLETQGGRQRNIEGVHNENRLMAGKGALHTKRHACVNMTKDPERGGELGVVSKCQKPLGPMEEHQGPPDPTWYEKSGERGWQKARNRVVF